MSDPRFKLSEFLQNARRLANKADRRFKKESAKLENRMRRENILGFRDRFDLNRLRFLPRTLDYRGEFGFEIITFLPFLNWLSAAGLLKHRTVRTYRGMRAFYEGLEYSRYIEKSDPRDFVRPTEQPAYNPVKDEQEYHSGNISPFHLYKDLRRLFAPQDLSEPVRSALGDKPLLIIHNKYAQEWHGPPVNFIPVSALDQLFRDLSENFQVVYIRHGIRGVSGGYVFDHSDVYELGDLEVLKSHPQVLLLDDLFEMHVNSGGEQDANRFKNILCARCFNYISVQGGGAHHLAAFSGSLMLILHRRGPEDQLAYGQGFYSFMANPAPTRMICGSADELIRASQVFKSSRICLDRVHVDPAAHDLLEAFSPEAFRLRGAGGESAGFPDSPT